MKVEEDLIHVFKELSVQQSKEVKTGHDGALPRVRKCRHRSLLRPTIAAV